MNAIITVVGVDRVGIIAKVSAYLAEKGVNIQEITQTIMAGNFMMFMTVNIPAQGAGLAVIEADLAALGKEIGVEINLKNEAVFQAMHRI
jgi:ACT domain-containing protein